MKNLLKELGIKIVILSRGRSDSISTTKLLPDFIDVLVPESQKEQYEKAITNPIITTPDDIKGLGVLRNWCLSNFDEETVIMLDDDLFALYCNTGRHARKITDPLEVLEILVNTAIMAKDAGCGCFGFFQTDIRKYKPTDPFSLCTWVGGVIGVIGKTIRFRNDKFKVDIDFCLTNILVKRIVWCDNRYTFYQNRDNNKGGNAEFRNQEDYQKSCDTLKQKWGKYISIKNGVYGSQTRINLKVKRKQDIKI